MVSNEEALYIIRFQEGIIYQVYCNMKEAEGPEAKATTIVQEICKQANLCEKTVWSIVAKKPAISDADRKAKLL